MLLNCGVEEDSWESLDCKEIQPFHPKGDQSWIVIGSVVGRGTPSRVRKWALVLTLGNELFKETHVLKKQDILLGRSTQAESSRVRESRRTALPCDLQSQGLWWWGYFPGCLWPVILTQSPSWWCKHCPSKMDVSEKDSGRWLDTWCHLLTFSKLFKFSSFQFSRSVMSNSLQPHGLQHTRLRCPSPTPGACSNSCPSSRWCHPTISSSVIPFSNGSFQLVVA